jgi:RHS repeat-associated protein
MFSAAKKEMDSQAMVFSEGVLSLAAAPELSENSRQGFATKNAALFLSFELRNSTTALGIPGTLALEGVWKNDSARYYDPQSGRFLSEDPTRFDEGVNFYSYVGNNPIGFVDPEGLAMTPAQCKQLLEKIMAETAVLEDKLNKYDPVKDGSQVWPYMKAGTLKNTKKLGGHYDAILLLQARIWINIAIYQRECKGEEPCPQKVFEFASKKLPKPVIPMTPLEKWWDDTKWGFDRAWRDFMNPQNPPWWYWFNPNPGRQPAR